MFVSSIKMWLFHIVFTWLTFSIFLVDLVYINAFLAGLVAIMPFVVSVGNREEKARDKKREGVCLSCPHFPLFFQVTLGCQYSCLHSAVRT